MLIHRRVAIRTLRLSTLTLELSSERRKGERKEKKRVHCIAIIEANGARHLNLCISIAQSFDMELSLTVMIVRQLINPDSKN